jgi:steroid delta-isomerase-like uncharacterized protein
MKMDEKNNPLVQLYENVINQGNLEAMDELYGPGYINHAAPFGLAKDINGLKRLFHMFIEAFPDQHITAEDIIIHGDKIIGRWALTATHQGTFAGVPATGKPILMTGIDIERILDGKIVEHWGGEDMLGVLQQIGAVAEFKP